MKADNDDEALKKYKEQLLGAAVKGSVGSGDRVVILEFKILFEDKSNAEQILKLGTKAEQADAVKTPLSIPQGANYKFAIKFAVNGEIVPALKFTNTIKSSVKNDESEVVLGSYAPGATHNFTFPRFGWNTAPSGYFYKGVYSAQMKFSDSDGNIHMDVPYKLGIK